MTSPVRLTLGLDLVDVERVAAAIDRWGERFFERVFAPGEVKRRRRNRQALAEHVAGLFAAKEAAMKALGTGWRGGIRFRDIVVDRDRGGKPQLRWRGEASRRATALGVLQTEVTISHTATLAAATVGLLLSVDPREGDR